MKAMGRSAYHDATFPRIGAAVGADTTALLALASHIVYSRSRKTYRRVNPHKTGVIY